MIVGIRSLLLVVLPLGAVAAQETRPAAQETKPKPDAAALEKEFTEARNVWNAELRAASAARDDEKVKKLRRERPEAAFLPRFQAGAAEHAGTDAAVPYLNWIVSHGDLDASRAALTTVIEKHVAHPGITRAVARLGGLHGQLGLKQSRDWLDAVLKKNEDTGVQAQARYTRASLYVGTRATERSEQLRSLAIDDLKFVQEHGSASLKGLAKGLLFEAENLEPGLRAPDISGEDLDGVPFKLSDYRGKVVLLDFWGDW